MTPSEFEDWGHGVHFRAHNGRFYVFLTVEANGNDDIEGYESVQRDFANFGEAAAFIDGMEVSSFWGTKYELLTPAKFLEV